MCRPDTVSTVLALGSRSGDEGNSQATQGSTQESPSRWVGQAPRYLLSSLCALRTPGGDHAQQSWLSREGVSHRVANPKIFATNPELVFVVCVAVFRCLERLEVSTRREEVKKRGPVLALDWADGMTSGSSGRRSAHAPRVAEDRAALSFSVRPRDDHDDGVASSFRGGWVGARRGAPH